MSGNLTIRNAELVLPDRVVTGDLVVEDGVITEIGPHVERSVGEVIYASGLTLLPGVIDPQVHFRDPGLTRKEDLISGSRAAAAGGITAFLDMPNTVPNTDSVAALHNKLAHAEGRSVVHYGFFIGANGDNIDELNAAERTCGIQVYMGASKDNLLVDDPEQLEYIFAHANKLIAVHAESESRLRERKMMYPDADDPAQHPVIRDVEAAMIATKQATAFALKYGRRLHMLHLTSAEEADYLATLPRDLITAEVCPQHLFLHAETAYERLGTRAQCNPPVRGRRHAEALKKRLLDGTINCIATDHAPHTIEEKQRPYPNAPSGLPGVEWSLPLMLNQVNQDWCTLSQVAKWMCEGPASCYRIPRKGRLEVGFDGDLVLVDMKKTKTIGEDKILSRSKWSPYEGWQVTGWPVLTAILGQPVFRDGQIIDGVHGRELTYRRMRDAT